MLLALKGLGGANRLDRVRSLITKHHTQQSTHRATIVFPGRYRLDDTYGESKYATAGDGRNGFFVSGQESWPMDLSVHRYFVSTLHREPTAILQERRRPDFRAYAGGTAKAGEQKVELLRISFAGTTTTLGVEPGTGRILSLAYRGRPGLTGPLGNYTTTYSDFREIEGLILPFTSKSRWNERELAPRAYDIVEVNSAVEPALFVQPK